MTTLEKIKKFAEEQFDTMNEGENNLICVVSEDYGIDVINPWMDPSGRFYLTDEQAIEVYGSELVDEFKNKVFEELK